MALVLADRVQETTTSTGTASVLLSGAVNGYQTFTAGVGNGNTCYYTIYDNTSFAWEVGIGTYTTSPNTLTRNTILSSSNSGSAINLAGNTAAVWVDYPSERAVYKDASGNTSLTTANIGTATVGTLTATSLTSTAASFTTITSGTWNGGIIGMTYGGTGASLLPTAGASVYSTGTNLALSAAGTSGQVLVSGGSGSPTWSSGPSLNASVIVSATLTGTTVASTVTATSLTLGSPLAITSGGTGSTSAAIVAGTAISVSGTFPNQTVNNTTSATNTNIGYTKALDYATGNLNPLLQQTIKRVISIDSQYRDNKKSLTSNFTFHLSEPLKDVVSMKLYSVHIPYTWYTISTGFGCNVIFMKGISPGIDNGDYDYQITINPGNYSPADLANAVNNSISAIKSTYTDISFATTGIIYNSYTSLNTFVTDITKQYNETSYDISFSGLTSPFNIDPTNLTNSNKPRTGSSNTSIPGFLGFANSSYI
jgi:hypothetical protein